MHNFEKTHLQIFLQELNPVVTPSNKFGQDFRFRLLLIDLV